MVFLEVGLATSLDICESYKKIFLQANATFTNGGLLNFSGPCSDAQFQVAGNFNQFATGVLDMELNGPRGINITNQSTFNNQGEINLTGGGGTEYGIRVLGGQLIN